MRLADYLSANNLSAAEFAAKIGVHRSTVGRWLDPVAPDGSVCRPSWEQIAKIKDATGGEVTANDFASVPVDEPVDASADRSAA